MQRREEEAGQHDHQAAEANNDAVDPGVGFGEAQQHSLLQRLQIGLSGDVVVDRVEDLGRDAFSLLAILASARALVRESRSVSGASARIDPTFRLLRMYYQHRR
jgi:hypothetical protein